MAEHAVVADHDHRTLKDWDGTLHRLEPGLYALNACLCDVEQVHVSRNGGRWSWDVDMPGSRRKSDRLEYRHRREAVDAALAYVHYGELAGRVVAHA